MRAPKNESADSSKDKTFETRNTIASAATVGAMIGFVIALWLGAISVGETSKFTDWIQSTAAVAASGISALAVVLVAKTLKATRETLDATRIMAEDQRQIGDAQTRAWVMVSDISVDGGAYSNSKSDIFHNVRITLKNYGITPAKWLRFDYEIRQVSYPLSALKIEPFGMDSMIYGLAPGQTADSIKGGLTIHAKRNLVTLIYVDWEYGLLDGRTDSDSSIYIACVRNSETSFRPAAIGDYMNTE